MEKNNPFMGYFKYDRISEVISKRIFILIALVSTLLLATTGCVTYNDYEASQEFSTDTVGTIEDHSSLGQSFISRRPLLNGITIWITIPPNENNSDSANSSIPIKFQLFYSSSDTVPIFSTIILAPSAGTNVPITIAIPATEDRSEVAFYLQLSTVSGAVQINGRNEDAYPRGQLYINQQPTDADLAFRISYEYDFRSVVQDVNQAIKKVWLVLPLLVVIWLPGWLLLDYSGIRNRYDWGEQTAISIGISLAITPVLMTWTSLLKLNWTREGLLFFASIIVALFFIRLFFGYISKGSITLQKSEAIVNQTGQINKKHFLPPVLLLVIFLFTLAIRLIMVRDLATPAWVDSVHHALITRLIIQNGGFPDSLQPFLDIAPSEYHLGFHSIAAVFTWLSNLRIDQSLLILGQTLNAAIVFSIYLLTKSLTRSVNAGIFATIITGFLSPMPAYYTSWGRYTELTGLLILPVPFVLIRMLPEQRLPKKILRVGLLGAITSAGLFMVHYRVVVFLVVLILAYLIMYLPRRGQEKTYQHQLALILILGVFGILLIIPWFIQTIRSSFIPVVSSPFVSAIPIFQGFSWAYLNTALGKQALVIAILGLIWGLVSRKRFSLLLLIWVIVLFILANFDAMHLPGGGLITNLSVEIMLFMPVSVLGGYFIDQSISQWKLLIPKRTITPFMLLLSIAVVFVAFLGAKQLTTLINPITILSRKADIPAIEWIKENIPEGESVVINPFPWGYGIFAGSDGGYWISPLSGRLTLPPPVLYGLGYQVQRINEQTQKIISLSSNPKAFRDFLDTNNYHYVFIGAKGGLISPDTLNTSGLFSPIYHHDGVWIFSTKP